MKKLAYAVALALVAPVLALTPLSPAQAIPAQGRGYHSPNTPFTTISTRSPYQASSQLAPGLKCQNSWGFTQTDIDNVWGNASPTDLQTACVDAMVAGEALWKMLADWSGRNGYDGNGNAAPVRVGAGSGYLEWKGTYAEVGKDTTNTINATSIDLVSHELAKMVVNTTGSGTPASNSPAAAINEAAADIIATATEWHANNPGDTPDYTIGEKVNLLGYGPIRNLANPSLSRQENCVYSDTSGSPTGSGAVGHWFYLLAEGSNPTNGQPTSPICAGGPPSVTGIGIKPAYQIFMKALESRTATWTVADLRKATLAAAKNLTPGQCTAYWATQAAWGAVAQRTVAGEVTCGDAVPMDFALTLDRNQATTYADQGVPIVISTSRLSGDPQDVRISFEDLPAAVRPRFADGSTTAVISGGTGSVTVEMRTSVTTSATYPFTVVATSPTQTKRLPFTWTAQERPVIIDPDVPTGPSFSVSANKSIMWGIPTETKLTVPYAATASMVKIEVLGVRHSCTDNLTVTLVAPSGRQYVVQSGSPSIILCSGSSGYSLTYSKQRISNEPTQGTWKLRVSSVTWQTGSWTGWKITFP